MKTDIEIKDEIYEYLKGSELMERLDGVLKKTKRPAGSRKEDVNISVLANQNGKIQEAIVYINIYIPDTDTGLQTEENSPRLREISRLSADLLEVVKYSNVRMNLESQHVYEAETGGEHVISHRMLYKVKNQAYGTCRKREPRLG